MAHHPPVGLRPGRSTSTEILPVLHSDMPATRSLSPVSSLGSKSRPPSSDGPADSVGANSAPPSPRSVGQGPVKSFTSNRGANSIFDQTQKVVSTLYIT